MKKRGFGILSLAVLLIAIIIVAVFAYVYVISPYTKGIRQAPKTPSYKATEEPIIETPPGFAQEQTTLICMYFRYNADGTVNRIYDIADKYGRCLRPEGESGVVYSFWTYYRSLRQ